MSRVRATGKPRFGYSYVTFDKGIALPCGARKAPTVRHTHRHFLVYDSKACAKRCSHDITKQKRNKRTGEREWAGRAMFPPYSDHRL